MEDMARTIDDLGVEISTRYAEDRNIYDDALIKEARFIPKQTQITTTLPTYASEFDTLFELGKQKALWAFFLPPPNYFANRRKIFSEQLIPDLGTLDLQEAKLERLESIGEEEKERKKHSHEKDEIENEKQIIKKLLKNLHFFDELLIDINSRRSQYQKG